MCDRAYLKTPSGWVEASTRGELRSILRVEPIYADADWPSRSDDDCLCSCDVPATAAAAGYSATPDCGDWELELIPAGRT